MLGLPALVGPSTANKFALTASVKRSLLVGWLFLAGIFLLVHHGGATPALPSVRLPAALARRVAPEQTPLGLPDIWQGKRIGIWEAADFHDEVAGALVYSLKKSGIEPRLFRRQGFRFGFLDAVKGFWPNPSWETDDEAVLNKAVLENEVDILVLSTCSLHIDALLPTLLDPRTNVHVGCLTHWGSDVHDNEARYGPLADTGRLSLITLSDHVERFIRHRLGNMAADNAGGMGPAWDKIDVTTFVPTFPVEAVHRTHSVKERPRHFPAKLGIQGNISSARRDYASVIRALHAALLRNPTEWGYRWSNDRPGEQIFIPLGERGSPEPFELHLMGNLEEVLEIPAEMEHVVRIHQGQPYERYYSGLAEMDALLPAFSHGGYVWDTASSSIAAALIAEIPVLCGPTISQKYSYLSGPALLPHPNSMDPIEAVRLYRLGQDPAQGLRRGGNAHHEQSWDSYLEDVDRRNLDVWQSLLGRLEE